MADTPEWTTIRQDTVNKWNVIKDEHRDAAKARAVTTVLGDGTAVSDMNPLPVKCDLEVSDIQIGAVELKDGSSNQRATVTSEGALKVTFDGASSSIASDLFGKQMITASDFATLVTKTIATGKIFDFSGVILNGDEYGYFEIKVNGDVRVSWRNSGSKRSSTIPFPSKIETIAGDIITIIATNNGTETRSFEASIFGDERDA